MATMNDTATLAQTNRNSLTVFKPELKAQDLYDEIRARVSGARAMAQIITCDGHETFVTWTEQVQHDYLYELAERLSEVENSIDHLWTLVHMERKNIS